MNVARRFVFKMSVLGASSFFGITQAVAEDQWMVTLENDSSHLQQWSVRDMHEVKAKFVKIQPHASYEWGELSVPEKEVYNMIVTCNLVSDAQPQTKGTEMVMVYGQFPVTIAGKTEMKWGWAPAGTPEYEKQLSYWSISDEFATPNKTTWTCNYPGEESNDLTNLTNHEDK